MIDPGTASTGGDRGAGPPAPLGRATDAATAAPTGPTTLVARSHVEAYLWVFIMRLIALLTAGRPTTGDVPAGGADDADPTRSGPPDPERARRVAASRPSPPPPLVDAPSGPDVARRDERNRAVAITTATAVVGAAAAFAVGRRRGAR